jgi:hypothetical protein
VPSISYFAVLFLGVVITAQVVGELEAEWLRAAPPVTTAHRTGVLLAGVVTLAVLRSIPVLGTAAVFAAIVFGLGAVGVWTYRAYLRPTAAATERPPAGHCKVGPDPEGPGPGVG